MISYHQDQILLSGWWWNNKENWIDEFTLLMLRTQFSNLSDQHTGNLDFSQLGFPCLFNVLEARLWTVLHWEERPKKNLTLDSLGEERRLPIELEVISLVEGSSRQAWVSGRGYLLENCQARLIKRFQLQWGTPLSYIYNHRNIEC